MIASPPLSAGAVTPTVSERLPGVMEETVGAPGVVDGVPDAGLDESPVPRALTSCSFSWYAAPFVRPVTMSGLVTDAGLRVVQVMPPSVDQRTFVAAAPPLSPCVNDRVSLPLPGATDVIVGAYGARDGVPAVAADCVPAPMRFTARTRSWYAVPFTREGIVMVLELLAVEVQVFPSSVEYWYESTDAPPLLAPSDTSATRPPSAGASESIVGASGTVAGVACVAALAVPLPWAFTERRRTW